jgi:hypothetical protein
MYGFSLVYSYIAGGVYSVPIIFQYIGFTEMQTSMLRKINLGLPGAVRHARNISSRGIRKFQLFRTSTSSMHSKA